MVLSRYRALTGLLLSLTALLAGTPAMAAGYGEPGPVYPVEIRLVDRQADLKTLLDLRIDVDGVFWDRARAYVVAEEEAKLAALGFDVAPVPEEPRGGDEPGTEAVYHTYETLTAELQQIAADHPSIARLYSIGKSVQNRDLWMMKISDNPDVEEDEPEFAYVSSLHGDEVVGKENCVNLINQLTDTYGTDPRITELVDATEIWILPSANPDGTQLHQRYNANGYDINRNFPDQFDDPVDTTVGKQVETAAIMNWGYAHSPALGGNFHGGTIVANYAYDGNASGSSVYTATQDDGLLVSQARSYADNSPKMLGSNSDASYNNGICNGADWYVINGGLQDYRYVYHSENHLTLEISTVKWPPDSQLNDFWLQNQESMLAYLERVHEGVRGVVTDATTGAPLAATVRVAGIDHPVYTDPDVGDYTRMLLPGHYSLEVSATGYNTGVVGDVEVVQGGPATRADFALRPLAVDLQHAAHGVLDGTGGNGILDPGESADLPVTLRDLGLAATNVSGRLVPTGWHGSVTRAEASWPDILTGGSAASNAPHFGIALASSAPSGYRAGFAIEWTSAEGSGRTQPFYVDGGTPSCTTVASTDVPKAIADRATASSTIEFPDDREIAEVNVYVDVAHTYIGDLHVTAVAPNGIPVLLHNRTGGSADNIVGWYDTALAPWEPLARLGGEHSSGTWTLRVTDGVPGNVGTIGNWSLEVCGRPFAATPEMRLDRVSKDAGGTVVTWWPYPGLTSYRVYRSTAPTERASFTDVTAEDTDATDTRFEDASTGPMLFWLVTGVGPAGEGPR